MSHRRNGRFQRPIAVSAEIHSRLLLAEEDAAVILELARQLSREVPTSNHLMVLGPVIHEEEYRGEGQPVDSGQLFQVAIRVPDGLGCCLWDTEEWAEHADDPRIQLVAGRNRFLPFLELPVGAKVKTLQHTGDLITRLLNLTDFRPGA